MCGGGGAGAGANLADVLCEEVVLGGALPQEAPPARDVRGRHVQLLPQPPLQHHVPGGREGWGGEWQAGVMEVWQAVAMEASRGDGGVAGRDGLAPAGGVLQGEGGVEAGGAQVGVALPEKEPP